MGYKGNRCQGELAYINIQCPQLPERNFLVKLSYFCPLTIYEVILGEQTHPKVGIVHIFLHTHIHIYTYKFIRMHTSMNSDAWALFQISGNGVNLGHFFFFKASPSDIKVQLGREVPKWTISKAFLSSQILGS